MSNDLYNYYPGSGKADTYAPEDHGTYDPTPEEAPPEYSPSANPEDNLIVGGQSMQGLPGVEQVGGYPDPVITEPYAPDAYGSYENAVASEPPQGNVVLNNGIIGMEIQESHDANAGVNAPPSGQPFETAPSGVAGAQPTEPPAVQKQDKGKRVSVDDLVKEYVTEEMLLDYIPPPPFGELLVAVRKLLISDRKNIFCRVKTVSHKNRVITNKIESKLYEVFDGQKGFYNDVFRLSFMQKDDKIFFNGYKHALLRKKSVGRLYIEVGELVTQEAVKHEQIHILQTTKPKNEIHLAVHVKLKNLHRIGALEMGRRHMKDGSNCILLANMTLQIANISRWVDGEDISNEAASLCLQELFPAGEAKYTVRDLKKLKGKTKKFPQHLVDMCFDKYGIKPSYYQVFAILKDVPTPERRKKLEGYFVQGVTIGKTMWGDQKPALDVYEDALKAYPKYLVEKGQITLGGTSYSSRTILLKDFQIGLALKGQGYRWEGRRDRRTGFDNRRRLMNLEKFSTMMGKVPSFVQ